MCKLRKLAVSCIFILLATGLFLTCDDPSNPFSNNLGEKVVVEPPTIDDISPVSGSYLRDTVVFTANAKAYIKVERVEVYIFEDKINGQKEVKWTSNGITLSGGLKLKKMEFVFDTYAYNNWDFTKNQETTPRDGPIRMMFRIFDTTNKPIESIELIYIIKNNPSVIKMVYPSDTAVEKSGEPANVAWSGDIRGSITDRRGLRPGFPQIKLWDDDKPEPNDPKDPNYGWATLFLTGIDDMEKEGAGENGAPAGRGKYEDRSKMRVVNAASFSLRLAEYDIIPDPDNPDLRYVSYKIEDNKHKLYSPNKLLRFKIRTRDVEPDPFRGSIPNDDPEKPWPDQDKDPPWTPWIEGFYPPMDFGTANVDWTKMRADSGGVEEPVRIRVFNADSRPTVEINNDDIDDAVLKLKPNKYITEAISKKIEISGFRLRLFALFEKGNEPVIANLEYEHSGVTKRTGPLSWDQGYDGIPYQHQVDGRSGTLFTYTSDPAIFTDSSEPYTLLFRVVVNGLDNPDDWPVYRYVVYIDGRPPNVSIRSVQGAADAALPAGAADIPTYTVNGNIQAVVDRTDDSGIMPFRENTGMGKTPPDLDNYPMVKWIVEGANASDNAPPSTGIVQAKLDAYAADPSAENLKFFLDIEETRTSLLTNLPSGWVKLPVSGTEIAADKNDHLKLNTKIWDKQYLWLYVIAMDQVQNLGCIAQKIYVDQDTDNPEADIKPLGDKNAGNTPIASEKELDVTVTITTENGRDNRKMTGNWYSAGAGDKNETVTDGIRNNILGGNDGIGLNFTDDDGISLTKGGVTITLTDLNVSPNKKVTLTVAQIKEALNIQSDSSESKRSLSGTLSQKMMYAALNSVALDQNTPPLRDGMYKIEITVKDDIDQKVKIIPHVIDGDTPVEAQISVSYFFAVSTEKPQIEILHPDNNALGSGEPLDIYGTVKSRLNIQNIYITFTPNVITPDVNPGSSLPILLDLWVDEGYTKPRAQAAPDEDGYYTYYWIKEGVIFHPTDPNTNQAWFDYDKAPEERQYNGLRRFTVEAYDRLGNLSEEVRTVQVDSSPPDINLIEFNYNRPADKDGKLYVYGKVSFSVSASDTNGMYEVDGMSGIKWWVLPKDASEPSWGTQPQPYTNNSLSPSTWTGGGNFTLDQTRENGKFTGVIDTRYLTDNAEYKFYCMAMDKAGNTARIKVEYGSKVIYDVILQPDINIFTVDQSRDYPYIYEDSLKPEPNKPLGKNNLIIEGTVGDLDLFNQAESKTNNKYLANIYVEISYPASFTPAGLPAAWAPWIPINVPATYTKDGGIDPSGDINYKFVPDPNTDAGKYFLDSDGAKYYQIRVTDEPDAGENNYGKNPDYFMTVAPDSVNYPGYKDNVYLRHDKVSKIFPLDDKKAPTDPEAYVFYVDNTKPEIFFNLYDPNPAHVPPDGNYLATRPTFSTWEQLKAALNNDPKNGKGNYVKEFKLVDMSMSWSAGVKEFNKTILNNPPDPVSAQEYPWNLSGFTAEDDKKLQEVFDAAQQGMQVISFEANDLAGLTGRVSWIFAKDTQGPEINFNTISRSIKRDPKIPPEANFPSNWPTNVTKWNDAWNNHPTWSSYTWKQIIENWPSEYAFKNAADVIAALNSEDKRPPSTVIGGGDTLPVIQGTFKDEYSSVRILVPVTKPDPTYFYYRFKDKLGNVQNIPTSGLTTGISREFVSTQGYTDPISNKLWIQKEIGEKKDNQTEKEADWEIVLNEANGFTGTDGENWVDIRVADTAGNISEIYNVRFLVDRTPPLLGSYRVVPPNTNEELVPGEFRISKLNDVAQTPPLLLPEDQRVISAAGAAGNGNVFTITGRVNDANLSNFRITLGQDGTTAYTVTASADIDLLKSSANPPATGNGVTITDDKLANDLTDTGVKRLTLIGPYIAGTTTPYTSTSAGVPEWEWTFDILAKDVLGLRTAAGDNADSTRRFIRVTASDKAGKREGPVEWSFYLDTKKPLIEYTNLDKGKNGSSFESEIKLSGLVSDDTKIKDVKFLIGKWNYSTKEWNWYNSGAWTTAQPAVTTWASAFDSHTSATNTTLLPRPTPATTMDFTITQAVLNAAGTTRYPANLFNTEGQYRIDLCVTDFSLGNGNAHNTLLVIDPNFEDKGTYYGASNEYNKPKPGDGYASGRLFYIDKKDPTLRWATAIEDKTYFRNDAYGQAVFGFIAGDGNTLQNWTAVVKEGDTIVSNTSGTIKWDVGTGKTSIAIPEPLTVASDTTTPATVGGKLISDTSIDEQYFEIKPYMTTTGTSTGTALDVGKNPLPTYSITITVTDGAKRTSTITKSFTLDNTPPEFTKFSPPSFVNGTPSTYDAVSGKFDIRGNTSDNSNQIRRVAFYVAPAGTTSGPPGFNTSYNFPNPNSISDIPNSSNEEFWHWHDPAKNALGSLLYPNRYKIAVGSTTFLEIEDGTFAWSIKIPQTSLFRSDANAQKYVQWTKTYGGKTINNTDYTTAHQYRDVTINPATLVATTTSRNVPELTFPDLNNPFSADPKRIYSNEDVGLITVYVLAEDAAGNFKYDVVKYWIWPEGDRPIVTAINSPDSTKIEAERLLNGTIRLSGMAKDNERVKNVWFRVLPSTDGKATGTPYTLEVPVWKETDSEGNNESDNLQGKPLSGNWDERTGKQTALTNASTIGSKRSDDSFTPPGGTITSEGGWYKANGGNAREVSWWVYINTKGELDPPGNDTKKEFLVEVRAQDVTWDDSLNNNEGDWKPYTPSYRGFVSTPLRVTAWVVAGAPIFENSQIAPNASTTATSSNPQLWADIDKINIRNRSSYKVTVKHSSGLSSIRWSPTQWVVNTSNPSGIFQANSDTYNLLDLLSETTQSSYYVYRDGAGYKTAKGVQTTVFSNMATATTDATPRMALTIDRASMKTGSVTGLDTNKYYLILNWDPADTTLVSSGVFLPDASYYNPGFAPPGIAGLKDLKNTVFKPSAASGNIGKTILIESVKDTVSGIDYFKWDVFADIRADLLLADMLKDDANYGKRTIAGREGQYENSVRYPLYLSASEVSKATPLTSRGDALLPIDNLPPTGMYTLNRKPAGTAVTIGGEAGDDGPVNGIARVVMWFQRGAVGVSWHETNSTDLPAALQGGTFTSYANASSPTGGKGSYINAGPDWWEGVNLDTTKYPGAVKPAIGIETAGTGGDSAIVIDTPSPSVSKPKWGHTLPTGFADGGIGKIWYVEINSYGIKSGPVDLHYVVIDKAGNYKHYREKLIIMNGVAVIDRLKLATDIRHNTTAFPINLSNDQKLAPGKIDDKAPPMTSAAWPILNSIRDAVPLGGSSTDINDDVKKGISDWIPASALGAGKVIDFNVRNNLFALRVETTKPPLEATSDYARTFRIQYVSGATLYSDTGVTGRRLTDIKAGSIYMVNRPGTAKWGMFGAEGDGPWPRGFAFIATVGGSELDDVAKEKIGEGSVWELTLSLPLDTPNNGTDARTAQSAEFRYATGAFSTIRDCDGPEDTVFPPTPNAAYTDWTAWDNTNNNPATPRWSLFILRVFDGPEANYFGDFSILRVRVNNDDKSLPFAQLYDLNPKAESSNNAITPLIVGEGGGSNRTKGGLWSITSSSGDVEKSGHIEPRRMNGTGYGTWYTQTWTGETQARSHSLSSEQMGGAALKTEASITKPWADPAGFFISDTVSGDVVLRGYAEDDQRVQSVSLVIGGQTINILNYPSGGTVAATPGNNATYVSPKTGMLSIPSGTNTDGRVFYTDSIDLYRHRVEWAYVWNTETIPASTVVGNNISVRVISYPRNGATGTASKTTGSAEIPAPGAPHVSTPDENNNLEKTRPNTSPYNKDFPVNLNKYNSINVNLRPYITGFLRNQTQFSHNTRSRQGRYMFFRGETAVLKGFNLGSGSITLPAVNTTNNNSTTISITTANVGTPTDFGLTTANNNNTRYRQFTVNENAVNNIIPVTGNGLVTYTYNSQNAVNTSGRAITNGPPIRPTYIQPWNIEYSPGIDGSRLWDDFTQVHIWQSNDTTNSTDGGRFPKGGDNMEVFDPSMSIDPATGTLWSSHNEGGGNGANTGSVKIGNNSSNTSLSVAGFVDPIINSDIFISTRQSGYNSNENNNAFTVWTAYSIIGKTGGGIVWASYGGLFVNGPKGGNAGLTSGLGNTNNNGFNASGDSASRGQYLAESTYYNSQENILNGVPQLNQFKNPHVISDYRDNYEHIHVSYYDTKDGSVKYRYNRRGSPENVSSTSAPKAWTNLDGGFDKEDQDQLNAVGPFPNVSANGRIVGYSTRPAAGSRADVGEYNSIALTSQGYPVVAYYDRTNQKLKIIISSSTTPVAATNNWGTPQDVIASGDIKTGTGEYVSMRIDTRATTNVVHIAAMNSLNKNLVYIKGTISGTTLTNVTAQVVDSVGSVGRWCSLSLDANGNPWISYQDESYQGSRDGVKLAYYNQTRYYKGSSVKSNTYYPYQPEQDVDMYNVSVNGWEAMHVPTKYRVENARGGMENYPVRNPQTFTGTAPTKFWRGAVGYLGQDYFRVAYYVGETD